MGSLIFFQHLHLRHHHPSSLVSFPQLSLVVPLVSRLSFLQLWQQLLELGIVFGRIWLDQKL